MLKVKFGACKQDETTGDLVFPVSVFDDLTPGTIILTGEERFAPNAFETEEQLNTILLPLADQWKAKATFLGVEKEF